MRLSAATSRYLCCFLISSWRLHRLQCGSNGLESHAHSLPYSLSTLFVRLPSAFVRESSCVARVASAAGTAGAQKRTRGDNLRMQMATHGGPRKFQCPLADKVYHTAARRTRTLALAAPCSYTRPLTFSVSECLLPFNATQLSCARLQVQFHRSTFSVRALTVSAAAIATTLFSPEAHRRHSRRFR